MYAEKLYKPLPRPMPYIIGIPSFVTKRLDSFNMDISDVLNVEKMRGILSPSELFFYYQTCHLGHEFFQEAKIVDHDFLPVQVGDLVNQIADESVRKKMADSLMCLPAKFSDAEIHSKWLNIISDEDKPTRTFGFSLRHITQVPDTHVPEGHRDIFGLTFYGVPHDAADFVPDKLRYNVYEAACEYLFNIYGFRWVAQTKLFAEMVRLSQLPILNQTS